MAVEEARGSEASAPPRRVFLGVLHPEGDALGMRDAGLPAPLLQGRSIARASRADAGRVVGSYLDRPSPISPADLADCRPIVAAPLADHGVIGAAGLGHGGSIGGA